MNIAQIKKSFLASAAVISVPVEPTLRQKLFALFDEANEAGKSILTVGHGLTTEASLASYRSYWRKARSQAVTAKAA